MPRITSKNSFSAGPRREASKLNVKKIVLFILIPVLILAILGGAYAKRDVLKSALSSVASSSDSPQPRDSSDSTPTETSPIEDLESLQQSEAPQENPQAVENTEITPQKLQEAITKAYSASIVHTAGTINVGDKKVAFDTVWTPDHVSGSGSLTYNGKQTETYLVEKMILIKNQDGIVGDLIGKPVPMQQWVIVNADDDLNNIYPMPELLAGVAQETQVKNDDPNFTTEHFIVTLNPEKTVAIGVGAPKGNWSIQPGTGEQILAPGADIQIEGKIEKTPEGQWKVFRFA